MPHFLIEKENIKDNFIYVEEPELLHHLVSVLRVKINETLKFIDIDKNVYSARVLEVSKKKLTAEIIETVKSRRELGFKLYLAASILKNDAQNLLIANATELGVKGLYPFLSDFSTVKEDFAKKRTEKFQKISNESFKQCERADLMLVFDILPLEIILEKFKKENIIILAERCKNTDILGSVKDIDLGGEILVVTGPEGGFSDREFEFFKEKGFKMATLGNLIYRAPNAVTAGVSNVIFALEMKKRGISN